MSAVGADRGVCVVCVWGAVCVWGVWLRVTFTHDAHHGIQGWRSPLSLVLDQASVLSADIREDLLRAWPLLPFRFSPDFRILFGEEVEGA